MQVRFERRGAQVDAVLAVPDTDYQFRYVFRRDAKCWTLIERHDDSL